MNDTDPDPNESYNARGCVPNNPADVEIYLTGIGWRVGFYQHGQWWLKTDPPMPVREQNSVERWKMTEAYEAGLAALREKYGRKRKATT